MCNIISLISLVLGILMLICITNYLGQNAHASGCIQYHSSTILIKCQSTNLANLHDYLSKLNNITDKFLIKEPSKCWLLNANIEIYNGSNFYINSTDTNWLKINSTAGLSHSIKSHGNLIIDAVKITGWDTKLDDYARSNNNGTDARSYLLVNHGTGNTNISNSEIAYLGYNFPSSFGLTYYTGSGSTIKNNKIHDLYFGFYSSDPKANNIIIENNEFYNNKVYGIDPHSGTHDLIIKNNKVYNNGKHGIICSTDCYNIIIESNKVHNNMQEGIMLYKNVSNSVIKNNILSNNREQIAVYDSSNKNKISNNSLSSGKVGIRVTSNSSHNQIYNNSIMNSNYGIYLLKGASDNVIDSNRIANTSNFPIIVQDPETNNNIFRNNILLDNQKNEISRAIVDTNQVSFINNTRKSIN